MITRKIISFTFVLMLLAGSFSFAFGTTTPQYLHEAEKLNVLSLFQGDGNGFELDRPPTRIEAGIIFVRLVGGEKEALTNNYEHPFTDIPSWGQDHVGFLYKHKLVRGITDITFGGSNDVRACEYMTMALRSIGYKDDGVDFNWNESLEKALEIQLVAQGFYEDLKETKFLRDHVVKISYDLLKQPVKGDTATLAEKLLSYGAFTQEILDKMESLEPSTPEDDGPDNQVTPEAIGE